MALKFDRIRIQNALVAAAMAANMFYGVSYDPSTHVATEGVAVAPVGAIAGETGAQWVDAIKYRRSERLDRSSWNFELDLRFDQEVLLEKFEQSLMDTPIVLARDPANGLDDQITLKLRNSVVTQPIQQEVITGTKVVYAFEAVVSRN